MRIKSKDEVIKLYKNRSPELDSYFIKSLEEEYDKHYEAVKNLESLDEINDYFEREIEKNEQLYNENALVQGVEMALTNQYMSILANYGLIVFFRDNMIE